MAGTDTPRATGLPAPKSIAGETEFTSPKGFKYRIIHTTEVDPSDQPKPSNPRPKGKQPRHKDVRTKKIGHLQEMTSDLLARGVATQGEATLIWTSVPFA